MALRSESYDYLVWYEAALLAAPVLKERIDWRPRFAYVANIKGDHDEYVASCACGGSFCSPEFRTFLLKVDGQATDVVVREDIRNWMVYQLAPEKFLTYMRVFKQKCLDNYIETKYAENCASRILPDLGIEPLELNQKIDEFLLSCAGTDATPQSREIFEAMLLDRTKMAHVSRYPIIIFNH